MKGRDEKLKELHEKTSSGSSGTATAIVHSQSSATGTTLWHIYDKKSFRNKKNRSYKLHIRSNKLRLSK